MENSVKAKRRAAKAGLVYVNVVDKGITRHRCGKGFVYRTSGKRPVRCERLLRRIESLVIPPAWRDVFICPTATGHIQAVGVDEAGRRQYIYHERWLAISSSAKFDRMRRFGELLPKIRRKVQKDLKGRKLTRNRVLAAVIRLLDKSHLRVGNREYAESNGSHGATTLLADHVQVQRTRVRLEFPGKSGQQHEIELVDEKVAKVVRQCEEIEGQFLFQYFDSDGVAHSVSSSDVNDSLKEMSGESITAKDFRTWWGSVTALAVLETIAEDDTKSERKRKISSAIAVTSKELGNTKAVCRASYIHPGLLAAAETGEITRLCRKLPNSAKRNMTIGETRFLALLPRLGSVSP